MKLKIENNTPKNQTALVLANYEFLANSYIKQGDLHNARILIEETISLEPDNDKALRVYAEILFALNKHDEALIQIERALEIAPENHTYLNFHAVILNKLNRSDEALVQIERTIEIAPNMISWNVYANILHKVNKLDQAKKAIEYALNSSPLNGTNLTIDAQILAQLNNLNEVLATIEQALLIDPDSEFSLRIYAQILLHLNRPIEALIQIDRAIQKSSNIDRHMKTYVAILSKLNELTKNEPSEDDVQTNQTPSFPPDYYSLAIKLSNANKYHDALILIEQAVPKESEKAGFFVFHAHTLLCLERFDEALVQIKRSLDLPNNNSYSFAVHAQILCKIKEFNEAQDAIERSLNLDPSDAFNWHLYAEILKTLNKLDETENALEQLLKLNPNNTSNWHFYAETLKSLNKLDEAQNAIEQSLNLNPNDASNWQFYAETLKSLNKLDEAQYAIEQSLNLNPNNVSNLQFYAQILKQLGKPDLALPAIEQALNIMPGDAFSWFLKAQICSNLNMLIEAERAIKNSISIALNIVGSWQLYAQILLQLNKFDNAQIALEQALQIEPDNSVILMLSAENLFRLNKLDDALIQIDKALSIEPDNDIYLLLQSKVLYDLNRLEEALAKIERALYLAPDKHLHLKTYAQILSALNRLDEAKDVIEIALSVDPCNEIALFVQAEILNKLQVSKTLEQCIDNTFISKKYFNASLPSQHNQNSGDKSHPRLRHYEMVKFCAFQQIKDVKQGSSLEEFTSIALNINKSKFTYYTKEPTLPSSTTPCIFIMAGRQSNAAIPTLLPAPNRIVLVITEEELNRLYLTHENALLLPENTDLLVINHLESHTYGNYTQPALINCRRAASLCVAFDLKLNYVMLMDDNIEELNGAKGALTGFNQLWLMHQPSQLLSSVATSSNRSFSSGEKQKLGSKLFIMNAVQLQQVFDFIKPEELAFFLFLPPHCSNLVMEDYYFQLILSRGVHLNNLSLKAHLVLDEQTISLTRSSANRGAAKKSVNSFGAFAWLSLNKKTFITDSLAQQLSADRYSKTFIHSLIKNVVKDIKRIVTNNLHNTNGYLSEGKQVTLNKIKSGNKEPNKLLNKKQLWELIKKYPNLNLRPPQINAIELWINKENNGYLASYSIATGVGKTYIKAIMAYLELACTDQPVIVVSADQKLVNNLTEKFTSTFEQLNTVTQLNLSSDMIIPVMSSGNRAVSQGSLAVSDGFKVTQNLYIFCEDSFLKLIQEQKVSINHASLILLDEYHCYTKTLDAAIKAVQGFLVHVGHMDEGASCYCIDVDQDCISLFDTLGTKRLLDLKPSHIFDSKQIKFMKGMITYKNSAPLRDQILLNRLHAVLQQEQQKIPFPTFHFNNSNEIPLYWGNELPATTIKLVAQLPAEMSNERITYLTPTGIYQTNQTGITRCVITEEELIDHWRKAINEPLEELQSMLDYFAANINDDDFKRFLNQLIINNEGLPCMELEAWEQLTSPECFILTNTPPQLIYRNQNGKEREIASGFELYQILGVEMMNETNYFERIAYHPFLDLNKFAALKQLCTNKQLASFPNITRESNTNIIGFSATPPPHHNPLNCVFTYSKETAEQEGYITPSIVRLMKITDFKNIPYKNIFNNVLNMSSPEGVELCKRKGLYRFKSINELQKAEQILRDKYIDLSIYAVHTPKGKEYGYDEKKILSDFSTIPYNQGAILLIVSKLQKGWDEPRLSYTVDFKKNPGINSAIQFLGRATRVCYDKNDQKQPIAHNKIGLGFFPTSAKKVDKHLEPLKKPLPQNKRISNFYSSDKNGCIEAGDYNLNSRQMKY